MAEELNGRGERPSLRLYPSRDDTVRASPRDLEELVRAGARGWGMSEEVAELLATDVGTGLRRMYGEDAPAPLPSLADTWDRHLSTFLDPDPFLLRTSSAGMGRTLDRLLGGGLSVGQTCAVVSAGAGVGKTALLHQLADGVAEASARAEMEAHERGFVPSIVPVIFVSEMTTRDLTLRSLARRAGVPGYLLRDPRGEVGCRPLAQGVTEGEDALEQARIAARKSVDAARFMVCIDRRARCGLDELEIAIQAVRQTWVQEGASVPAVLVVIDPVHRLLDPTKSEVEGLGILLPGLMDLAQRTQSVVLFSSDTNRAAASTRSSTAKLGRGDELADAAEMAFRGSYQLLHMPDVALGLMTLRADDENLSAEDRERLEREPKGTVYAEVVNAKSRWEERGQRAAYFLDPAMFRYRPAAVRGLPAESPVRDRVLEFVSQNPRCSESAVRKNVAGRIEKIREAVVELLRSGELVDHGTPATGRRLSTP